MRVYVGLQIRHPGFESRRRLSSHGNFVNAGVMTGTFERNGLRFGGLWWNYRLHYVGVASMQELIQG